MCENEVKRLIDEHGAMRILEAMDRLGHGAGITTQASIIARRERKPNGGDEVFDVIEEAKEKGVADIAKYVYAYFRTHLGRQLTKQEVLYLGRALKSSNPPMLACPVCGELTWRVISHPPVHDYGGLGRYGYAPSFDLEQQCDCDVSEEQVEQLNIEASEG